MTVRIDGSTDLAGVAERLGVGGAAELRRSTARREPHLQKYARLLANDPTIDLQLNPDVAASDVQVGNKILIPTREFPQPVTEIPRRTYDLLCQETLVVHEVGHLLYSDWPSLQKCFKRVESHVKADGMVTGQPDEWVAVFQELWNAAEDGVIESELSARYRVRNQLDIFNANLSEAGCVGSVETADDGTEIVTYTMADALTQALLDASVHDSGRTERILDDHDRTHTMNLQVDTHRFAEVQEQIPPLIDELKRIPDAAERNQRFCDFFIDELYPVLKEAEVSGVDGATDQSSGAAEERPDDAHEGIGEAQQPLSEPDSDSDDGDGAGAGDGEGDGDDETGDGESGDEGEGEGEGEGEASPGEESDEGDGDDGDGEGDGDDGDERAAGGADEALNEAEAIEKYQEALAQEAREMVGDDLMEELEVFQEILQSGAGEAAIDGITIPDPKTADDETKQQAKTLGRRLKPIIKDQLRESRQDTLQRRKSFGTLDTRSMIDAERGSLRVFQRQRDSDEKDYSCVLVMDRSGSMAGQITETEVAIGAFMYALESVGVDVMCLDFCNGELRLAVPFGAEVDEHAGTLFTGERGGGTPLGDALYYARRRVDEGRGTHPFVMVVTDGEAGNRAHYDQQLEKTNCPVIGLYLDQTGGGADRSEANRFHRFRAVQAGNDGDLATALQQLAREVML